MSPLHKHFILKQLVKFPTPGSRTLDHILTNLQKLYQPPQKLPPLVFRTILPFLRLLNLKILEDQKSISSKFVTKTRGMKGLLAPSLPNLTGQSAVVDSFPSFDEKWSAFESIIRAGMDILLPIKTVKRYFNQPPWVTQHFKSLIRQRQKALVNDRNLIFNNLRYRVNRERKQCRCKYSTQRSVNSKYPIPNSGGSLLSLCAAWIQSRANVINQTFLEPMHAFQPLTPNEVLNFSATLNYLPSTVAIPEPLIFKKLFTIVPTKAPDPIPGWLPKENADVPTSPVC